jgi:transposase
MDAFVDKLDLSKLGFVQREACTEGRPAIEIETLLKIYFYGYVNGIRIRKLERENRRQTNQTKKGSATRGPSVKKMSSGHF